MATIPHRGVEPIAMGRPSYNLGNVFHSQLNVNRTLPVNIFESHPLTLSRGLLSARSMTVKAAQSQIIPTRTTTVFDRIIKQISPTRSITSSGPRPAGLNAIGSPQPVRSGILPFSSGPYGIR